MKTYYKEWDKFDVDKELEKIETQDNGTYVPPDMGYREPRNQAEMMQRTSGAKPGTKILIKGGTVRNESQAEMFKKQGNAFFTSFEYGKALDQYTKAIHCVIREKEQDLLKICYSNRAQSFLKLKQYKEAERDATEALDLDPEHLKSIQRRGTARYYLKNFKGAQKDFRKSLQIDPENSQMISYFDKVKEKLAHIKTEAYEKMKRAGQYLQLENPEVIPVDTVELNLEKVLTEYQQQNRENKKEVDTQKLETLDRQKKKKKNKKKGLAAFMEDDNETREGKVDKVEEEKEDEEKKGVRFGQNEVKEFNKNERIVEVAQTLSQEEIDKRKEVIMKEKKKKQQYQQNQKPKKVDADKLVLDQFQFKAPKSSYQFETDFKSLKSQTQKRLEYLMRIESSEPQKLFKSNLPSDLLEQILQTILETQELEESQKEHLRFFLTSLSKAEEFDMAKEFFEEKEKQNWNQVAEKLGVADLKL